MCMIIGILESNKITFYYTQPIINYADLLCIFFERKVFDPLISIFPYDRIRIIGGSII